MDVLELAGGEHPRRRICGETGSRTTPGNTFSSHGFSFFFTKEMELSLVGLQNAGKTSLVNVLTTGSFAEDMMPTVGFNMRKVTRGGITIKLWDLGGQTRFRSMWERYCRGVQAIVFVVDSGDIDGLEAAKTELHELLSKSSLAGIPLLVLGNKNDLPEALSVADLTQKLDLQVCERSRNGFGRFDTEQKCVATERNAW